MNSLLKHRAQVEQFIKKQSHGHDNYKRKQQEVLFQITSSNRQLKKQPIGAKVENMKQKYNDIPAPNAHERIRYTTYTSTPLLQGKIQNSKLLKQDNLEAVKDELPSKPVHYKTLRNLLKHHEPHFC